MRAIRRRNTKPEVALASALHRAGCRFRRDFPIKVDGVTIRPDIVFTRRRVAVFVDGCFWHTCPDHGRAPKINDWYWLPKLQRTQERDERSDRLLRSQGWSVVRVWEHMSLEEAVAAAMEAIDPPSRTTLRTGLGSPPVAVVGQAAAEPGK
jgi:DNA mismatch endonuclease (patch repair protein)